MATNIRSKFSERQMGYGTAVDVLAKSPQSRRRLVVLPISSAIINTATYASFIAVRAMKIIDVNIVYPILPLVPSGTQTVAGDVYTTSGSSANMIAATSTLANFTAHSARQMAMVSTPLTVAAGAEVLFTFLTSNNAPTINTGLGSITLTTEPIEDTIINDTDVTTANS